MPALIRTELTARVAWLGAVGDRDVALQSRPKTRLWAGFDGPRGEAHGGLTRPSCSRVRDLYPVGTEIRNTRQFSILSTEELALIATDMGLDTIDPALLGATLVLSHIPDFTHLPPASRLQIGSEVTLVTDVENHPCNLPAPGIEAAHSGYGKRFKMAAKDRRGLTACVEREGEICLGDPVVVFVPGQRAWQP